jgi:Zn-dependent alcohol dehydrogenase
VRTTAPRFARLAERGFLNIDAVITMRVPLEEAVAGWQAVADRTTLGMVVVFPE